MTSGPGPDPVVDRLTEEIRRLFASVLRAGAVAAEDDFFDLGGHSLLALELLAELEQRFGVDVTVSSLYDQPSPGALATLIASHQSEGGTAIQYRYLVPIQPRGSRPPIFGIHVLGLNSEYYRPLAARLGTDQPLFGLGLPDANPDTSGPTSVAEVAARYAEELERCQPSGPVTLTAVSLGSVVAYELAHQLQSRGRTVALLALFDAVGPDITELDLGPGQRLAVHGRELWADPGQWIRGRSHQMHRRLERVRERGAIWGRLRLGLPLPNDLRVRQFVEANWRSQAEYRFEPYPGRLVVFKAGDDPFTASLATGGMGWARVAAGPFDVEIVPGGHLSMLADPHVAVLADILARHHAIATMGPADSTATPEPVASRPITYDEVEAALRRALADGRFGPEVGRWLGHLEDLDEPAAALVARAEATTRALAVEAAERGREAGAALATAGIDAQPGPVPERLASVRLTLRLTDSTAATVGRAALVLSDLGYRRQDRPDAGPDHQGVPGEPDWAQLVNAGPSCTFIRTDAGTSRLDLAWRSTNRRPVADGDPGPVPTHGARPGPGDHDLGIFLGTPVPLVAGVLAVADPTADDVVLDLGCGDGRVVIEAVRRFGCRARGIEVDPHLAALARHRVAEAGLTDRIEIVEGDGSDLDLDSRFGRATIVFLFLPPEVTAGLLPDLLDRLDPGSRVVAHEQLAVAWSRHPTRSRLVVDGGVTVAHLWRC